MQRFGEMKRAYLLYRIEIGAEFSSSNYSSSPLHQNHHSSEGVREKKCVFLNAYLSTLATILFFILSLRQNFVSNQCCF